MSYRVGDSILGMGLSRLNGQPVSFNLNVLCCAPLSFSMKVGSQVLVLCY